MAATGAKAETVTWTASDMTNLFIDFEEGLAANNTIKGITVTASSGGNGAWQGNNISMDEGSTTITFTSSVGNIKSIEITAQSIYTYGDTPSGWTMPGYTKLSWSGDASPTVSMTLSDWTEFSNISEIVFTIEPAAPAATTYSVTLAEGTEDGDNWTISPTKAAEGAKVTVTYSGEKKVKSVKAVKVDAAPAAVTTATPLTMECLSDGTIKVNMSSEMFFGMQYAVNGGDKTKITTTTTIGDLTKGDKVQFYGVLTGTQAYGSSPSVMISGGSATVKVYGNIMSLVDETGFANNTELKSANAFTGLFYGNDKLTDASGLLLPATTLNQDCYANMFYGCTALTAAPALPATTLKSNCYSSMFYGCTVLTAAPELPATELVNGCYYKMFAGCTKLATVTCKATKEITVFHGLDNWLEGAGTDESITSRTLYVDPTMVSNTGWQNANFTVTAIPGN